MNAMIETLRSFALLLTHVCDFLMVSEITKGSAIRPPRSDGI